MATFEKLLKMSIKRSLLGLTKNIVFFFVNNNQKILLWIIAPTILKLL